MKNSKKLIKVICLMLLTVHYSCSNEDNIALKTLEQQKKSPKVENERLVFKDKDQFSKYLQDDFLMKQLETELKEEDFSSLKEVIKEEEKEYANFILNLYNKNREIQIGTELIYINNWKQYVVKNKDEKLLHKIKKDIKNGIKPEYKNIEIYNIKIKRKLLNDEGTQLNRSWVDAKYQYNFHDNGTPVKFVFEAYVNRYYVGLIKVDYGVRIKYEWLHGRWWKISGDNVYKQVRNLSIVARSGQNVIHSYNTGFASYEGSNNFVTSGTFYILPANSFHIYFSGNFYAQVRQGSKPRIQYVENCSWVY